MEMVMATAMAMVTHAVQWVLTRVTIMLIPIGREQIGKVIQAMLWEAIECVITMRFMKHVIGQIRYQAVTLVGRLYVTTKVNFFKM